MKNSFCLRTVENNEISCSAFGKPDESDDIVILVHGFKGFKDWGFFPYLGERIAQRRGFSAISLNFSHNGIGNDPLTFSEPEKFAKNTISLELSELRQLINYCSETYSTNKGKRIHLLGHSRGAGVAILAANRERVITSAVLWAPVMTFMRWTRRQTTSWRKKGYMEVVNSRTGQVMQMDIPFLEDVEKNRESFDILKAAKEFSRPLAIIHGENDLAVKPSEGLEIFKSANPDMTEIHLIERTGHTFDVAHPMTETNGKLEKIIKLTVDFFEKIAKGTKNDN